jgi:hypothetical protein
MSVHKHGRQPITEMYSDPPEPEPPSKEVQKVLVYIQKIVNAEAMTDRDALLFLEDIANILDARIELLNSDIHFSDTLDKDD